MTTVLTMLSPQDVRELRRILDKGPYVVKKVGTIQRLKTWLTCSTEVPIVLCDEGNDWRAVLQICEERYVPKVIICSRREGMLFNELWSGVLHLGAYDLFALPFLEETVVRSMKLAAIPQPPKTRVAH